MSNGYKFINYQTPVLTDINNFLNTTRCEANAHLCRLHDNSPDEIIIKLIETLYYLNKTALNINFKSLSRNHTQTDIHYLKTNRFRHVENTYNYFENIVNVEDETCVTKEIDVLDKGDEEILDDEAVAIIVEEDLENIEH